MCQRWVLESDGDKPGVMNLREWGVVAEEGRISIYIEVLNSGVEYEEGVSSMYFVFEWRINSRR